METSMAQAQTLKARVALPPVRQEEDEGSPHFSALDATTVDADDEELPFNIAALALKRELFARYRAYMRLARSTAPPLVRMAVPALKGM